MKKFTFIIVSALLLLLPVSGFAHADTPVVDVSNINQQLQILNNSNMTIADKQKKFEEIISAAPVSAQRAFLKDVANQIKNKIPDEGIDVGTNKVVNIDSGITLDLTSNEDNGTGSLNSSSNEIQNNAISSLSITGYDYSNEWFGNKDYGDRLFTCTVSVKYLGMTLGKLVLENHFSVGSYGLEMRYTSSSGTQGLNIMMDIRSHSSSTTDGVATHDGADLNGKGKYDWAFGIGSIKYSFSSEITSTIKLITLHKSGKYAYVGETYTFNE